MSTHKNVNLFVIADGTDLSLKRVVKTQAIFNGHSTDYGIKIVPKQATIAEGVIDDFEILQSCLKHSTEEGTSEDYVIVVKDTSCSTTSASDLSRTIAWAIKETEQKDGFDIMWLSKWMDDCSKHRIIATDARGMSVVKTSSPYGLQCLLFSPAGVKKMLNLSVPKSNISLSEYLNANVRRNAIKAVALHPSPVKFDTSEAQNSTDEYAKMCECADPKGLVKPQKSSSNLGIFTFILIAILIAASIYILVNFGSKISDAYMKSGGNSVSSPIAKMSPAKSFQSVTTY
jgi:hypothetical protein